MEISAAFLFLVPVIVGLTQVAKVSGLKSKWAPLLSIVLGMLGAFVLAGFSGGTALGGIVAGLTACGLWSGTKTTLA
jgi:hypothetical protein